jgi:molecular chaperone GrpE
VAPPAEEPPVDPLVAAQEEAKRLKDQLLRTLADFDNFRKRSRRDVGDAEKSGREEFLRELLPVFDNLERAVGHAETATDVQSLSDGIRMVMRQFADTLEKVGIERVPSVGTAFDPALHEAIQHLESSEHPPGTVTHEVQGGYRTGDRLIRPALVVVAKPPTDAEPSSHSGA